MSDKVSGAIERAPAQISGSVTGRGVTVSGNIVGGGSGPAYRGPYEVTPTSETQVLPTEGKRMTADVVVNPIPSNYGLITWDGSKLTVS